MNTQQSIIAYSDAGYPACAIATSDEDRTISAIMSAVPPTATVLRISALGGLKRWNREAKMPGTFEVQDASCTFQKAFDAIAIQPDDSILIVLDFQHVIKNAMMYRALRDALRMVKASNTMIVLVAPSWQLPAELEHDVPIVPDALPTREELTSALQVIVNSTDVPLTESQTETLIDAASGLTLGEAESAFALAYKDNEIQPRIVINEKMKLIRQSGYLEVSEPKNVSDLGGLGRLREYIRNEVQRTLHHPKLKVRGILLVGVPGTGKSLSAKVAGGILGWPVLRCDIANLKGSKVGQSEQAIRDAMKLAEAVSPCILYLDEIEKAIGGYASSAQTDSGVTLGMLGALLTWLQEHTSQVITIATCNDYSKLPAELTRAGRFDERFFVDLPTRPERAEIGRVHLANYDCAGSDEIDTIITTLTGDWTGAEIEQLVKSAARLTNCNITADALRSAAKNIRPIAKVRATEIAELRKWGTENLRLANTAEPEAEGPARKVRGRA